MEIKRGDIVQVDFDPVLGREIAKSRPVVVIQNDVGNQFSPTTIVVAVTGWNSRSAEFPFCVEIPRGTGGLSKRSLANCARVRTIDLSRITRRPGSVPNDLMASVDTALRISLALD
ncbi:MAG: type II toxin-antitoxin system PemK/MazF family toxin [Planctomycetota bacterium]|nr:type II toxin-antitoxin system PemK/MazF family toxin [Planctomycetota bacterium]